MKMCGTPYFSPSKIRDIEDSDSDDDDDDDKKQRKEKKQKKANISFPEGSKALWEIHHKS